MQQFSLPGDISFEADAGAEAPEAPSFSLPNDVQFSEQQAVEAPRFQLPGDVQMPDATARQAPEAPEALPEGGPLDQMWSNLEARAGHFLQTQGKLLERVGGAAATVGKVAREGIQNLTGEELPEFAQDLAGTGDQAVADFGSWIEEKGVAIAKPDYSSTHTPETFKTAIESGDPGTIAREIGGAVLEHGPSVMADMALIMTVPAAFWTSLTEQRAQERAKNDGRTIPTSTDYAWAAGVAGVESWLERVGASGALLRDAAVTSMKQVPKAVGKGLFKEGATEGVQSLAESVGTTVGTEKGFDLAEAGWQAGFEAAIGGGVGGPVAGVSGALQAKFPGLRPEDTMPGTDESVEDFINQYQDEQEATDAVNEAGDLETAKARQMAAIEETYKDQPQKLEEIKAELARVEEWLSSTGGDPLIPVSQTQGSVGGIMPQENTEWTNINSGHDVALRYIFGAPEQRTLEAFVKQGDYKDVLDHIDQLEVALSAGPSEVIYDQIADARKAFFEGEFRAGIEALHEIIDPDRRAFASVSRHDKGLVADRINQIASTIREAVTGSRDVDIDQMPKGESTIWGGYFGDYKDSGVDELLEARTDKEKAKQIRIRRRQRYTTLRRVKEAVDPLIKAITPGTRVLLVPSDVGVSRASGPGFLGWMGSVAVMTHDGRFESVYVFAVRPDLIPGAGNPQSSSVRFLDTVHHEFGHVLARKELLKANALTKRGVMNDYRTWLNDRSLTEPVQDFQRSYAPIHRATETVDPNVTVSGQGVTGHAAYWYSFDEFLAEHVARVIGTMGPETSALTRPFYRRVWSDYAKFYKEKVTQNPELKKLYPSVEAWVKSLKYSNDALRIQLSAAENQAPKAKDIVTSQVLATDHRPALQALGEKIASIDPPKNPQAAKESRAFWGKTMDGIADFNWFHKSIYTLPQLERRFANVPGVKRYMDGVRQWWATKGLWSNMAVDTLKLARQLGVEQDKQQLKAFEKFVYALTLKSDELSRKLTTEEKATLAQKTGVSEAGLQLWQKMDEDYKKTLAKLFEELRKEAQINLSDDPVALRKRLDILNKEYSSLRNQDYFPLMRFGRKVVKVKAKEPVTIEGKEYTTGQVVYFSLQETDRDNRKEYDWAKNRFNSQDFEISSDTIDDSQAAMIGMPKVLIQKFIESAMESYIKLNPNATEDAISEYRQELQTTYGDLMVEYSPGSSFKKRLLKRQGTPGFSTDSIRTYATSMQNFANFISRMEHSRDILGGLDDIKRYKAHALNLSQAEQQSLGKLRDYLSQHYSYLMTPGNEWANLRSAATVWFLGFVPRSALVNLTQIPLATQPYLAERYGEVASIREISKAMRDLRAAWTSGKKGRGIETDLATALQRGYDEQFLNESLASELGAYAEGSTLQRILPGWVPGGKSREVNYSIRQMQNYSMAAFQFAERINRLTTFVPAYRLSRDAQLRQMKEKFEDLSPELKKKVTDKAFADAREAVERTQGEYARWARPNIMKGKKSIIFLFKLYMQHMAMLLATDPSRWRFLRNSAILGGIIGAPFAQNLLDVTQMLVNAFGDDDEYTDVNKIVREHVHELEESLGLAPDLLLKGVSHYAGPFDLQASLSLGNIAPGTEALTSTRTSYDAYSTFGRFAEGVLGPAGSILFNMMRAVGTDTLDDWKRWERAMPISVKNVSKSLRVAEAGGESANNTAIIESFDPHDSQHMVELVGMGLGFSPRRLSHEQEKRWEQQQAEDYYKGRATTLKKQYFEAYRTKDREGMKDAIEAVKRYNLQRPKNIPGISTQDLRTSIMRRLKDIYKTEQGYPLTLKYKSLYDEYADSFPETFYEEPSR